MMQTRKVKVGVHWPPLYFDLSTIVAELERLRLLKEEEEEKEREQNEIRKRALEQQERNKQVAKKLFEEQELSKQANDQKKKRKTKDKVVKVQDKYVWLCSTASC